MNWLLLPLIASIVIIIWLLSRGPKIIYKDESAEKKATLELEISQKKSNLELEISKKRERLELELAEEKTRRTNELLEGLDALEKKLTDDFERRKDRLLELLENDLEKEKEKHLNALKELEEDFKLEKLEILKGIEEVYDKLIDIQEKNSAAVEVAKRKEKLKEKDNFYKINLNESELIELEELDRAIKKLRNPLPFRKAIYSVYYQPKINNMIKRVVGVKKVMGIYKITHIESEKVYVGKSNDIGNRWKQHAKRGCGADTLTTNNLYPALLKHGLENFTWEIIQIIEDSNELSKAEKYWQDFYKAKEFGYSMK